MEPKDQVRSVHVLISGRVQGVGYRAWVKQSADELKVSGWVRNRRDGDVEAVFSGPQTAVDALIEACRDGPPWSAAANVQDLRVLNDAEPESGPLTILRNV